MSQWLSWNTSFQILITSKTGKSSMQIGVPWPWREASTSVSLQSCKPTALWAYYSPVEPTSWWAYSPVSLLQSWEPAALWAALLPGFHTLGNVSLWLQGFPEESRVFRPSWSQVDSSLSFSALSGGSGLAAHPWVTLFCSRWARSAAQAGEAGRHLECRRHCLRPGRLKSHQQEKVTITWKRKHWKTTKQQTCVCNPSEATACAVKRTALTAALKFDTGQDRPGDNTAAPKRVPAPQLAQ